MNRKRREKLIPQYAAGDITWSKLRELGFDSYVHVLGELGKLKLRPPVAPMEGPNVDIRQRGCGPLDASEQMGRRHPGRFLLSCAQERNH